MTWFCSLLLPQDIYKWLQNIAVILFFLFYIRSVIPHIPYFPGWPGKTWRIEVLSFTWGRDNFSLEQILIHITSWIFQILPNMRSEKQVMRLILLLDFNFYISWISVTTFWMEAGSCLLNSMALRYFTNVCYAWLMSKDPWKHSIICIFFISDKRSFLKILDS